MKNAIRRRPSFSRAWSVEATSSPTPTIPDIAGSSAAETAMPKRLTGNSARFCAYPSSATEPTGSQLARN